MFLTLSTGAPTACATQQQQPEALGHLVEGIPFHQYYFPAEPPASPAHVLNTMASPKVRLGEHHSALQYTQISSAAAHCGLVLHHAVACRMRVHTGVQMLQTAR